MSNGSPSVPARVDQVERAELDRLRQRRACTRMRPALAPLPRRKCRCRRVGRQAARVGGVDAALRRWPAPWCRCRWRRSWRAPARPASRRPSSRSSRAPRRWRRRRTRCAAACRLRARAGLAPAHSKWCSSRKNEVRLVVRQLTNSCHSGARGAVVRLLQPAQVVAERAVAGLAQAARQAAVDHRLLAGVQADAGVVVDEPAHALEVVRRKRELLFNDAGCRVAGLLSRRAAGMVGSGGVPTHLAGAQVLACPEMRPRLALISQRRGPGGHC